MNQSATHRTCAGETRFLDFSNDRHIVLDSASTVASTVTRKRRASQDPGQDLWVPSSEEERGRGVKVAVVSSHMLSKLPFPSLTYRLAGT